MALKIVTLVILWSKMTNWKYKKCYFLGYNLQISSDYLIMSKYTSKWK